MPHQKYFSPAKINLTLKVIGKRPDGYHDLSTQMQTIDLGDTLHFEWKGQEGFSCSNPNLPVGPANLVNKAIDLFRCKTGFKEPVKVHLEKKIPFEAGLGGGSSNAATTLWALNEYAGKPATIQELLSWSAEIGSDIPFFFSEGSALCEGRGDRVRPLPAPSGEPFWILKPASSLSTADVYQNYVSGEQTQQDTFFNDLEASAFYLKPELYFLKKILLCSFERVMMSGSGTAFICMGKKGTLPTIPNTTLFPVRFIHRQRNCWYSIY